MTDAENRSPERVALYVRVSSEEQAEKGYSVEGQIAELTRHAEERGWEVVASEKDEGFNRKSVWRPGLNRVRALAAAGKVDVVLAWKRDRFGALPVPQALAEEFAAGGAKLRALDDSGEGDDAEFLDGIKDLIAKRELRQIARRSRMGKYAKARQGLTVGSNKPPLGFAFNEARDGYEVDEPRMEVVRRIFREVGAEGKTLYAVRKGLEASGVPSPSGGRYWHQSYLRKLLLEKDEYKPHTRDEALALVPPEAAGRLEAGGTYGIAWFGEREVVKTQLAGLTASGKPRYSYATSTRPREERVAIAVPDAGVPLAHVKAARSAVAGNRRPSSCGKRFWELSGGVMRCSGCGCAMQTTGIPARDGERTHFYYRCPRRVRDGKDACPNRKNFRADDAEPKIWGLVSGLLKEPETLRAGLDRMLQREREKLDLDPVREAAKLRKRIGESAARRERRLQQHAEGFIGTEELRGYLRGLDEERATAERELERLGNLEEAIAELERDRDAVLASYEERVPEALDALPPEERHRIYRLLRVTVTARPDGSYETSGVLRGLRPPRPEASYPAHRPGAEAVSTNGITRACAGTLWGPPRS